MNPPRKHRRATSDLDLERYSKTLHQVSEADKVLDSARSLAKRHGLRWELANDREIAIALTLALT